MTTHPKTNRIPAPIYAAAGAGELALKQLRKLPTVVSDLGTKAAVTGLDLRQKATRTLKTANLTATGLRERVVAADLDLDKLREAATRNAAAVLAGAHAAQERALAAYAELVARGERVVGAGVLEAADTVNADIEATEAGGAAPVAEVATLAEAKRTRATKATTAKPAAPSAKLPRATKRTRPAAE